MEKGWNSAQKIVNNDAGMLSISPDSGTFLNTPGYYIIKVGATARYIKVNSDGSITTYSSQSDIHQAARKVW
ncbi:hypothetical protein BK708_17310 [Bacillus thuringiensis serovar yunnanensis]|nr:hypothetical protein BK708_17310 [Bacillus thuringiensis serovar yunnanensis]